MPVTVDEVVESAAAGVLRALDARGRGREEKSLGGGDEVSDKIRGLVKSGFHVSLTIRCGGWPLTAAGLNPQTINPAGEGEVE
jgi:hypothetical protein